ncbi:hypothetical protein LX87_05203 [Larkinella arboricola]|uniref:Uncharacterized protein n=1 Tax=Larkinella arboricola TaxID=643671 RepID=A0A327WLT2_LARAB|nr:hypothetical protein LX87_05203 [Larkinella arboricola]
MIILQFVYLASLCLAGALLLPGLICLVILATALYFSFHFINSESNDNRQKEQSRTIPGTKYRNGITGGNTQRSTDQGRH